MRGEGPERKWAAKFVQTKRKLMFVLSSRDINASVEHAKLFCTWNWSLIQLKIFVAFVKDKFSLNFQSSSIKHALIKLQQYRGENFYPSKLKRRCSTKWKNFRIKLIHSHQLYIIKLSAYLTRCSAHASERFPLEKSSWINSQRIRSSSICFRGTLVISSRSRSLTILITFISLYS